LPSSFLQLHPPVAPGAAKLRPVVIDESLTGMESLRLVREMGYNGVAVYSHPFTRAILAASTLFRPPSLLTAPDR
jgi:hypothetical protein